MNKESKEHVVPRKETRQLVRTLHGKRGQVEQNECADCALYDKFAKVIPNPSNYRDVLVAALDLAATAIINSKHSKDEFFETAHERFHFMESILHDRLPARDERSN